MAERKGESWLVWGVLALMVAAGLAALALAPASPGGGGNPNQNHAPIPRLSPSDATINLGETINFDAANSTDQDGDTMHYAWDFGDGETAATALASHKYEITGAFRVRLDVTDAKGLKNSTSTNVWVNLNQQIPGAIATWNVAGSVPSQVSFPVDPNATRGSITMELNTSSPLGAHAIISVLDPASAVIFTTNVTLTISSPSPLTILLDAVNLTVDGQWTVRVEAQPTQPLPFQYSATVGYTGTVRVEYKP